MSRARLALERFFFGEVAAVRPWLLLRGLLLLLAFDCVIDLVPHGARYGASGFNVAHFAWLDVVAPAPTAALYVGLLFACALLALTQALAGPSRLGLATLTALYTYAWAASLLDAYQHHYLLSLLLLSAVFFPLDSLASLEARAPAPVVVPTEKRGKKKRDKTPAPAPMAPPKIGPRMTSAYAYVSFGVTCTIVYFYTAITKLEGDFRSGAALARIVSPEKLEIVRSALDDPWMDAAQAYRLLAWGAIALQLVTALGLVIALTQDRRRRGAGLVALLGLAPIAFHLGASAIDLEIGWFSYYMVLIHLVLFAPAEVLTAIARGLDAPRKFFARWNEPTESLPHTEGLLFASLGLLVVPVLYGVDLPGAGVAAVLAAFCTVGAGVWWAVHGAASRSRTLALSAMLAAATLRLAVVHGGMHLPSEVLAPSTVRYDFYRFMGGDHKRRGERALARDAYRKARMYAPDAASRALMTTRLERLEGRNESERRDMPGAP